jgi:hypothetical protein
MQDDGHPGAGNLPSSFGAGKAAADYMDRRKGAGICHARVITTGGPAIQSL